METIRSYLSNLFAALPRDERVQRLHDELLATMEDKYNELKEAGRSENEAIGIVISEFGNIDELLEEIGVSAEAPAQETPGADVPVVDHAQADEFLDMRFKFAMLIGIGVFLCLLGCASFLLVSELVPSANDMAAIIVFFVFIAAAVGLFIYGGLQTERFAFLEKKRFQLAPGLEAELRAQMQGYAPSKIKLIILGVVLLVLSPVAFLTLSTLLSGSLADALSIACMLCIVGAGVYLLIQAGVTDDSYKLLLQEGDHAVRKKERDNTVIAAVASIWWPIITCIYLGYSFYTRNWSSSWIIWPIAGILFGAFSAAYSILKGEDD